MNRIYPKHITIENVAGICNSQCKMCLIDTIKRKGIMSNDLFIKIITKFVPYLAHQEFLSLCGIGEPLLDKGILFKIKLAKDLGFKGIGVYTNGSLLDDKLSYYLLFIELDTLIVSIDGYTPETYNKIRKGLDLNEIINNVETFIDIRQKEKGNTRLILRYTIQEENKDETYDFFSFWNKRLREEYQDNIFFYNVHNVGGNLKIENSVYMSNKRKCSEMYERMYVLVDGTVGFCCGDYYQSQKIGNVVNKNPIVLYNSRPFREYRGKMEQGRIIDLELCKKCSVLESILTKVIV